MISPPYLINAETLVSGECAMQDWKELRSVCLELAAEKHGPMPDYKVERAWLGYYAYDNSQFDGDSRDCGFGLTPAEAVADLIERRGAE
jgi:hypothetical protein